MKIVKVMDDAVNGEAIYQQPVTGKFYIVAEPGTSLGFDDGNLDVNEDDMMEVTLPEGWS